MDLKIKAVSNKIGKEIPLPFYATPGSAAMDLHACLDEAVTIPAGGRRTEDTCQGSGAVARARYQVPHARTKTASRASTAPAYLDFSPMSRAPLRSCPLFVIISTIAVIPKIKKILIAFSPHMRYTGVRTSL